MLLFLNFLSFVVGTNTPQKKHAIADVEAKDDDNEPVLFVCVIAHNWLNEDATHCFYPENMSRKLQSQAAKECWPPTADYINYPCKVRGWYSTYEEARKRLNKAVSQTDLESETDGDGTNKARRKRKAARDAMTELGLLNSDDEAENEDSDSSSEEKTTSKKKKAVKIKPIPQPLPQFHDSQKSIEQSNANELTFHSEKVQQKSPSQLQKTSSVLKDSNSISTTPKVAAKRRAPEDISIEDDNLKRNKKSQSIGKAISDENTGKELKAKNCNINGQKVSNPVLSQGKKPFGSFSNVKVGLGQKTNTVLTSSPRTEVRQKVSSLSKSMIRDAAKSPSSGLTSSKPRSFKSVNDAATPGPSGAMNKPFKSVNDAATPGPSRAMNKHTDSSKERARNETADKEVSYSNGAKQGASPPAHHWNMVSDPFCDSAEEDFDGDDVHNDKDYKPNAPSSSEEVIRMNSPSESMNLSNIEGDGEERNLVHKKNSGIGLEVEEETIATVLQPCQLKKMSTADLLRILYEKVVKVEKLHYQMMQKINENQQLLLNRTELLTLPKGMPKLPVATFEDVKIVEDLVKNKPAMKEYVVKYLSLAGNGTDDESCTKKVLARLLSNHVGTFFNWRGRQDKVPFKEWSLSDVVLLAARNIRPNADADRVEKAIKDWLKGRKFLKQ